MYILIRILVGCIFFGVCLWWIRNTRLTKVGIKCRICAVVVVVLLMTSVVFPFENLFVHFDSPTDAYKYMYPWKGDVKLVVNGRLSDLVVGGTESTDEYLIFPKTPDGWKLGTVRETKCIMRKFFNGGHLCIYRYKETSDYYIVVVPREGPDRIADSLDSDFVAIERYIPVAETVYYIYYANLQSPDDTYRITIDEEIIRVFD